MAIVSKPYYSYECDWEGCPRTADDDGEFTAWAQPEGAMETLLGGDVFQEVDDRWYCIDHWHWDDDGDVAAGPEPDHKREVQGER